MAQRPRAWKHDLPDHLRDVLETSPANVTRKQAAEIISRRLFKISHRSLERWPIASRNVNGRAHLDTAEALAEAWRRFEAAPVLAGGSSRLRPAVTSQYPESDHLE